MKEEWLFQGAVVPVDVETTAALMVEIKRLIDVVGGMALAQQETHWDALAEKHLASIKRDMRISLEDAAVRATHKVMAKLEQEPVAMAKRILELEALLERQTACIVDLQTHIDNFEGEDR